MGPKLCMATPMTPGKVWNVKNEKFGHLSLFFIDDFGARGNLDHSENYS